MTALYTVRCKLSSGSAAARGSDLVEFTLHFEAIDDQAMVDMLPALADTFDELPVVQRWTCERGPTTHQLVAYRRLILAENSWDYIGDYEFNLPPAPTFNLSLELHGVVVAYEATLMPKTSHQRGAILCIQEGETPAHKRRLYVGPISDHYLNGTIDILGGQYLQLVQVNPLQDGPPPEATDTVDLWRVGLAEDVAGWLSTIETTLPSASSVVPSFKDGSWSYLRKTRASTVRAEMRSRGLRGSMTQPYP